MTRAAALIPSLFGTALCVAARAVPPHDPGISTLDVRHDAATSASLEVCWSVHEESLAASMDETPTDDDRAQRLERFRSMTARSLEIDRTSAESWSIGFEPRESVFVLVGRFALAANVERVTIEARMFDALPRGHRMVVSAVGFREQRRYLLDAEHPTCELARGLFTPSSTATTSTHWWIYLGALPGVVLTLFFCRLLAAPCITRGSPRPFDSTLPFLRERT